MMGAKSGMGRNVYICNDRCVRRCVRLIEKAGITFHYDIPTVIIHGQGNILLQYVPRIKRSGLGLL